MRRVDRHESGDLNELGGLGVESGVGHGSVLQIGRDADGLEVAVCDRPNPVLGSRSLTDHASSSRRKHQRPLLGAETLMVSASSVPRRTLVAHRPQGVNQPGSSPARTKLSPISSVRTFTSGATRAAARSNSRAGAEPDLGAKGTLKVPQ